VSVIGQDGEAGRTTTVAEYSGKVSLGRPYLASSGDDRLGVAWDVHDTARSDYPVMMAVLSCK